MKRVFLTFGIAATVVFAARADNAPELNRHHFPDKAHAAKPGGGGASNLVNHGGPVIVSPRVVAIFWGPTWSSTSDPQQHIVGFFQTFATSGHMDMLPQYSNAAAGVIGGNLFSTFWNDTSTPPTNVTDAILQQEVLKYFAPVAQGGGGGTFDASTIYEVFLPSTSFSSDGTSTSCGGPNLAYCAYHGHFSSSLGDVKYSSMPWPGCGGCQSAGFTIAQNFDHFSCHETREAITDEDLNAWFDRRGNEADDKCAWSPTPFIDPSGFAYQYEWSNAAGGCVK